MSATLPPTGPPEDRPTHAGPEAAGPGRSGRRTALVAGVTAGTLAVVGVSAFAAVHLLSGGPQAEMAIPADALAVVSLDLDPGAKQKVEALRTLRKLPGLKRQLRLGSGDDLRRRFFDETLKVGDCKHLSYDSDVKPWIGDNLALAAVPFAEGKVSPVLALAVTDQDRATRTLHALLECSDSGHNTAFAFDGDFVLISDSQAHADQAAEDARSKPLSDDASYRDWSAKVGDRGVANFYVARSAAGIIADAMGSLGSSGKAESGSSGGFANDLPSDLPTDLMSDLPVPSASVAVGTGASVPHPLSTVRDPADTIRRALADFKGAAGALRFADGGAELEVVGGGVDQSLFSGSAAGDLVTGLPGDTTAAFGIALPQDFAANLTDNLKSLGVPLLGSGPDLTSELQDQLGITVPGDLETLLGEGIALSLSGTPVDDLTTVQGPEDVPAGLTIKGDPFRIKSVISKMEAKQGKTLADSGVAVEGGNGKVTVSFQARYAKELQGNGDLGDHAAFRRVVPEADKASAVVYVDLNSRWRQAIARALDPGSSRQQFLVNTEPLEAFGLSSWSERDTSHLLVELTTD